MLVFNLVYARVKFVKQLKHYMNYWLKNFQPDDYGHILAMQTLFNLKDFIVNSFMMNA